MKTETASKIKDQPFFGKIQEKSINNSHKLLEEIGIGYQSDAGIAVTNLSAMQFSTIFTCVRIISESIGILPLTLYEKVGDSRKRATGHHINDLISLHPNDYQTSQEFWELAGAMLAGRGNFYAYKNVIGNRVTELLPLAPDAVTAKRVNYQMAYKVKMEDGSEEEYTSDEIMHIRLFSLDGGATGVNPITYARNTIGLGMVAEKQSSSMFKNGSRLSGILSTEQVLDRQKADELSAHWDARNAGASRSGKTAVLGNGVSYQPISISPEDAQLLESRKFQRTDIGAMFRLPAYMLGDWENAHHNNMENAGLEFVNYCLMSYLTRIEQRIKLSLFDTIADRRKYFSKFNVNALVRGDLTSRGEFYSKMLQNGVYSPNKVLAFEDEPPREGGDSYMTPLNMALNGKPITHPKGKKDE